MFSRMIRAAVPPPLLRKLRAYRASGPVIAPLVDRYCTGRGIEIGAGKSPCCPRERTVFLDRNVGDKDATEGADIIANAWEIPADDGAFDFVLSSHVLEHMPNPILTVREWVRVLKPGGHLVTILPHAERTIDRFRAVTTLDHLLDDYRNGADESDRTHFEEMKAGWSRLAPEDEMQASFRADWGADCWDWEFRIRHGVLHYHVWTQDEIVRLMHHFGLAIAYVNEQAAERPDSFVVVATKS